MKQLELQKFSDKLKAKTSVDAHQAIVLEILMEIIPVRLVWMHIKQKYLNFFWKLLQLSNGFFEWQDISGLGILWSVIVACMVSNIIYEKPVFICKDMLFTFHFTTCMH